jgi:hypothetical protein
MIAEEVLPVKPNRWQQAVRQVSNVAQEKLPSERHGHIQRATALVLDHGVFVEDDGETYQVRHTNGTWAITNGHCACEDSTRHPGVYCKHALAKVIYYKASEVLREEHAELAPTPEAPSTPEPATVQGIPREHLVMIQGKPFVKFAGLLHLAHAQQLVELTATWTYNDVDLSLAHAVAIFEDGRRFEESGDASPSNVTHKVKPHFRRVALTRAKSRALRDALGIDMVAYEELGDTE